MKKWITHLGATSVLTAALILPLSANAADYKIDNEGMHASVNFRVSHLGYSFTQGRFDKFSGTFSYNPTNVTASKVDVTVDTSSVDSNHAERDKHIRTKDFLNTSKFPAAKFTSTKVIDNGDGRLAVEGNLDLHGKVMPITIDAKFIGAGDDPWGGRRAGFKGTTRLELKDFGIKVMGPTSYVLMDLYIEGVEIK